MQQGDEMPESSAHARRGPVTLVVTRPEDGGKNFSWTFANETAAVMVARVVRQSERWTLVRGVYASAAHALDAARSGDLIVHERGAGALRKCEPIDREKQRNSA
jgi:hypothetical protein